MRIEANMNDSFQLMLRSQDLAHEPEALNIDKLPTLTPDQLKQIVV